AEKKRSGHPLLYSALIFLSVSGPHHPFLSNKPVVFVTPFSAFFVFRSFFLLSGITKPIFFYMTLSPAQSMSTLSGSSAQSALSSTL
ncbi:hypothetical protein J008_04159, partial [Cryptococcus neoformans]